MGYWVIHEQNAAMVIFAENFGAVAGPGTEFPLTHLSYHSTFGDS